MNDAALVRASWALMQSRAHSFSRAARFLRPRTRDAVAVLYAFCRTVDDAVDEAPDAATAAQTIAALQAELTGQAPARSVVAATVRWCPDASLARAAALELVAGVASDVVGDGPRIIADDAELIRYAYRVAGTVGLLMCALLGVGSAGRSESASPWPFAIDLGVAMQLTNIARDVREDAAMGRVYLPATRLAAVGLTPRELLGGDPARTALAKVVRDVLALADRYYASADQGLRYLPFDVRTAVAVARHLYHGIGAELARRGWDAWAGRAIVPAMDRRVRIARGLAASLRASWPLTEPVHDSALHAALVGLPGIAGRQI